jgi:adenine-specific DNA glycosylase
MIVLQDGEAMTLVELARTICSSIDDCSKCPAAEHCRHGHNGMADWLRKVVKE